MGKTVMETFRIRSGELDVEVQSPNHSEAAAKAVKTYAVDALGLLMEITLVGGDPEKDGWYMSTERVLQDAGITYQRKDGVENMKPQKAMQ